MLTHLRKVVLATFVGLSFVPAFAQNATGAQCKETLKPLVAFLYPSRVQQNVNAQQNMNHVGSQYPGALTMPIGNFADLTLVATTRPAVVSMNRLAKNVLLNCSKSCEGIPIAPAYNGVDKISCNRLYWATPQDLYHYINSISDASQVAIAAPAGHPTPECFYDNAPAHCNSAEVFPEQEVVTTAQLPPPPSPAPAPVAEAPINSGNVQYSDGAPTKSLEEIYQEDAFRMRQKMYKESRAEESSL